MYEELVKALHDGAEFLECSTPGIKNTFAKMCHNAADAIEELSDEELAELLTAVAQKSANKLCESLKTVKVDLSNCNFQILYEAHLDWLKEEALP